MANAASLKPFAPAIHTQVVPHTPTAVPDQDKKNILFVTSEFTGLVKAGGLGDVSAALPKALAPRHDVRILIPGYRQVLDSGCPITVLAHLDAYADLPACAIARLDMQDGPVIYVIVCPELYERPGSPYGDVAGKDWSDNHIRFARLGLAAAEIALGKATQLDWLPDLVHANDWPSALAPAYMAWRNQTTPSIFTIHNLAYQGLFDPSFSVGLGLPDVAFTTDAMEFYGKLSFLKAGIVYANQITTVSATYAQEITQPEFGCGLDGLLKYKFDQGLLSGITNGIDESWEPSSDPSLVEGFRAREWEAKRANTRHVEKMFDLRPGPGPLFAVVSRLAQQKGLDLTLTIAESLVKAGGRLAVMGCGDPELETQLVRLAKRYPDNIGVHIGFNEADSRRIFAGSDFLLMPSRFEPCGLSQMYAQRFGSLPIATRTGGLADTIEDGLDGFLFREATVKSYQGAIERALKVYQRPNLLNAMRCRAMAAPQYWRESVRPYAHLYKQVLRESKRRATLLLRAGGWH